MGLAVGRNRFLLPIYSLIFLILIWRIIHVKKVPERVIVSLNGIGLILVILPIMQMLFIHFQSALINFSIQDAKFKEYSPENTYYTPDIYYIILDSYPREDILRKAFEYDNSEFLEGLEKKGFYIADCSQSNYSYTLASMASTLNMTYLDTAWDQNTNAFDSVMLSAMVRSSEVQKIVENLGYTTVTFENGYKWLQWSDPDYVFSAFSNLDNPVFFSWTVWIRATINTYICCTASI